MTRVDSAAPRPVRLTVSIPCLLACTAVSASAVTFRVGNDGIPPCTHATLSAAVEAAAANGTGVDQIYLSDSVTLASPLAITNQSLMIIGGFTSCNDDDPQTSRTLITAATNDAILVSGATSLRFVTLRNLNVLRPPESPPGRLLRIEDASFVTLANTRLSGGEADVGGNVHMSDGNTALWITDHLDAGSEIVGGEATIFGGGIYCEDGGVVELDRGAIRDNHAEFDGGGVYLNGCTYTQFDGQTADPDCFLPGARGMICNRAERFGGGIYAGSFSNVRLFGNATRPALLFDNQAEQGGGLYLIGNGTTGEGENAWIIDNDAWLLGGGALVRNGASLTLETTASNCARAHCSLVDGNSAAPTNGSGGAFAADAGGDITILQTTITGSVSDILGSGSVVHASGAGTTVLLEGCLVFSNQGSPRIDSVDGAMITAAFSTFGQVAGSIFDTGSGATVRIFSSILLPQGDGAGMGQIFSGPIAAGETRVADCILHKESTATLPEPPDPGSYQSVSDVEALFVNWAAGDLRLAAGSQAIDFCDTINYVPVTTDIELQARGFDVPTVANTPFGPFDLGADEWRPIFVAYHEDGTCDEWTSDTGGC